MLPVEGSDFKASYQCRECLATTDPAIVEEWESQLSAAIEETYNTDVEGLERIILDESGIVNRFHPHHCLVLVVKWLLINLYGRKSGYLNHQLTSERLQRKVGFCRDYLRVLDVVDAGISHNRGRTLWELYSAEMHLIAQAWKMQVLQLLITHEKHN